MLVHVLCHLRKQGVNFVNVGRKKGQTWKISVKQLQWLKTQNSDAHIENDYAQSSRCLSRYYGRDNCTTTTNMKFRTNEKKNNIIVLPFVGKSKSCCFICKHKNTGLAMVPVKPRVTGCWNVPFQTENWDFIFSCIKKICINVACRSWTLKETFLITRCSLSVCLYIFYIFIFSPYY